MWAKSFQIALIELRFFSAKSVKYLQKIGTFLATNELEALTRILQRDKYVLCVLGTTFEQPYFHNFPSAILNLSLQPSKPCDANSQSETPYWTLRHYRCLLK